MNVLACHQCNRRAGLKFMPREALTSIAPSRINVPIFEFTTRPVAPRITQPKKRYSIHQRNDSFRADGETLPMYLSCSSRFVSETFQLLALQSADVRENDCQNVSSVSLHRGIEMETCKLYWRKYFLNSHMSRLLLRQITELLFL